VLEALWSILLIDYEATLIRVCEKVLHDRSCGGEAAEASEREVQRMRAEALLVLGRAFEKAAKEAKAKLEATTAPGEEGDEEEEEMEHAFVAWRKPKWPELLKRFTTFGRGRREGEDGEGDEEEEEEEEEEPGSSSTAHPTHVYAAFSARTAPVRVSATEIRIGRAAPVPIAGQNRVVVRGARSVAAATGADPKHLLRQQRQRQRNKKEGTAATAAEGGMLEVWSEPSGAGALLAFADDAAAERARAKIEAGARGAKRFWLSQFEQAMTKASRGSDEDEDGDEEEGEDSEEEDED